MKELELAVIGLEVPHALHIHLVPINGVSDINFDKPKKNFSPDKMREVADKIRQSLKLIYQDFHLKKKTKRNNFSL